MQDPAEVVKISCAHFCISYPGLALINIGGLSNKKSLHDTLYVVSFLMCVRQILTSQPYLDEKDLSSYVYLT